MLRMVARQQLLVALVMVVHLIPLLIMVAVAVVQAATDKMPALVQDRVVMVDLGMNLQLPELMFHMAGGGGGGVVMGI